MEVPAGQDFERWSPARCRICRDYSALAPHQHKVLYLILDQTLAGDLVFRKARQGTLYSNGQFRLAAIGSGIVSNVADAQIVMHMIV